MQTFIYFTVSGIVQGIRPLVGYNLGAGLNDRIKKIFGVTLILGLAVMLIGTVLCLAIPNDLMGLFTDNPTTVSKGSTALRIISAGFILSAFSVVIGGMFEGLGMGIPSLIISLIRYVAIIPVAWLASLAFAADGVWNAFWITELISAVAACMLFYFMYLSKTTTARTLKT